MTLRTACWLTGLFFVLPVAPALASQQALDSVLREQAAIEGGLTQLEALADQRLTACWQRFAVNDCLAAVRREFRQQREPLQAQLLVLRQREREIRLQLREQRLQDKEGGRD